VFYLEFILLSETHRYACMSFDNNDVDFSTIGTWTEPKSHYKAWHVASSFRSYVHQSSYFTKKKLVPILWTYVFPIKNAIISIKTNI